MMRTGCHHIARLECFVFALCSFLQLCLWGAEAPAAGTNFTKGPYIQASSPGTVNIMWEAPSNHPAIVRFGPKSSLKQVMAAPEPKRFKGISTVPKTNVFLAETNFVIFQKTRVRDLSQTNHYYIYDVPLTNLKQGATYSYQAEMNGLKTRPCQFKTLDPSASSVRFIAYGDTRTDPRAHSKLASLFWQHDPDFILHTGDLVDSGKNYKVWSREFFNPLANVINEIPYFSVVGNHEEDGTNYLFYFHLPDKELWYSFTAGPVHVLALDYHFEKASSEQFRFASNDLAKATSPWKVVVVHYPMFNVGGHVTSWGHTNYLALFRKTKVDLVVAGHSHLYERFHPMRPEAEPGAWPITYITTGGGGAEAHASYDHPALAARATTNHFMVFDATAKTLRGTTYGTNGTALDQFVITKKKGQYGPDYLAQVAPEESMKLFYDLSSSLVGRAASLPATNKTAHVLLTVMPRKTSNRPAEMEISLTAQASLYYEMIPGPVKAIAPPAGGSNYYVWAEIRATGKKTIKEGANRELEPPLTFKARVKADDIQSSAYGTPGRVSKFAEEQAEKDFPKLGTSGTAEQKK